MISLNSRSFRRGMFCFISYVWVLQLLNQLLSIHEVPKDTRSSLFFVDAFLVPVIPLAPQRSGCDRSLQQQYHHFLLHVEQRRQHYCTATTRLLSFPDNQGNDETHDGSIETSSSSFMGLYVATTVPGLADVLSQEIRTLGGQNIQPSGDSAVEFEATLPNILNILLWSRVAHKILEVLVESEPNLQTRQDVYDFIRTSIPVDDLLYLKEQDRWATFSVSVNRIHPDRIPSDIGHSHFTALTIKNALVDAAREYNQDRPPIDTENPEVPIVAVLRGRKMPIQGSSSSSSSADGTFGAQLSMFRQLHVGSLHKRGYRKDSIIHKAALKESLAAGLLQISGCFKTEKKATNVDRDDMTVFVDPMMGSGTLLIEGIALAADVAPGILRIRNGVPMSLRPPICLWNHPDHLDDNNNNVQIIWKQILAEAADRAKKGLQTLREENEDGRIRFIGNDAHPGALKLAHHCLQNAGFQEFVEIYEGNCQDLTILQENKKVDGALATRMIVLTNPPWGVRLGQQRDMSNHFSDEDDDDDDDYVDSAASAWEDLGDFLRSHQGIGEIEAWVLSGNPDATRRLGLRKSQQSTVVTGQQKLRWLQYVLWDDETKELKIMEKSNKNKERRQESKPTNMVKNSFIKTKNESSIHMPMKTIPEGKSFGNARQIESWKQSKPRTEKGTPKQKTKKEPKEAGNEWLI
jgi:23S rRNA G2445 N2-methylase RlmL